MDAAAGLGMRCAAAMGGTTTGRPAMWRLGCRAAVIGAMVTIRLGEGGKSGKKRRGSNGNQQFLA